MNPLAEVQKERHRKFHFQSSSKSLQTVVLYQLNTESFLKIDFQDWYEKQYEKAFIPIVAPTIQRLYGLIPSMTFHRERQKHFKIGRAHV